MKDKVLEEILGLDQVMVEVVVQEDEMGEVQVVQVMEIGIQVGLVEIGEQVVQVMEIEIVEDLVDQVMVIGIVLDQVEIEELQKEELVKVGVEILDLISEVRDQVNLDSINLEVDNKICSTVRNASGRR